MTMLLMLVGVPVASCGDDATLGSAGDGSEIQSSSGSLERSKAVTSIALRDVRDLRDLPADRDLAAHLALATSSGWDAEARYVHSLERLQRDPAPIVDAIERAYAAAPGSALARRWNLIYLASILFSEEALSLLRKTALVPRDDLDPRVDARVLLEELTIRAAAIEGLGHLAFAGHGLADDALRQCLKLPEKHLRITAVQAMLRAGQRSRETAESLRNLLPKDDWWMITLREGDPVADASLATPEPIDPSARPVEIPSLQPPSP